MITAEMTWKKSFQPQVENEPIEKGESFSFSTAQDDAKNPGKMTTFVGANQNDAILEISCGE